MKKGTKAKGTQKSRFMSDAAFAELKESMQQALAFERGEKNAADGYRVTTRAIPQPPKPRTSASIIKLRHRMGHSQMMFAKLLNVSVKTIQAWEQGTRKPGDVALKLLAVAEKHPEALYDV
jgi:putative transcriptional regulator